MPSAGCLILPTQIMISFSIIGFSMYMLYIGKDPGVYLPVMTAVSGSWLPSIVQNAKATGRSGGDSSGGTLFGRQSTRITRTPVVDIEQPLLPH